MKFVVLTNNGSSYGKKMIQQLEAANIPIEAIVVIKQPLSYHIKLFSYVKKRVGIFEAIIFSIKMIMEGIFEKEKKVINYSDFKTKTIFTKGTNSPSTESTLRTLNPDILILAQTGVVRKNILSIAKFGTLNSHPAILPFYRGIDCFKWAMLNGHYSKIGSTVHWVNTGVDTGNIIATIPYEIKAGENEIEIEKNLYTLCIINLKNTLLDFINGKIEKGRIQQTEEGRQYYKMPLKLEKKIRDILSHKFTNSLEN
ncbi:MAG: formyltransferase family protein [Bacteroidia bacterium]